MFCLVMMCKIVNGIMVKLIFPPAKSQGRTVMTSDFVEPVWGFMQYNDAVWSSMKVNIIQYTVHCSTQY